MLSAWTNAVAKGGETALGRYYAEYSGELLRYAMHKIGLSSSEAEDVVQTAFMRFAAMPEGMDTEGADIKNVRAFLYRSVHNAAVDFIRRKKVRDDYEQFNQELEGEAVNLLSPERVAVGRQFMEMIVGALWSMPKKRRRLMLMHRFDGLSYAEIARRERLSETVVRKHVARAIADCQNALRKRSGEQ